MSRLPRLLASLGIAIAVVLAGVTAPASAQSVPPGSSISGTVTAADGQPLTQQIIVSARQGSYNANWIAYVDKATGRYTIDGLPTGSYLIVFMPLVTDIFVPQYREQLYDGVYSEAAATRIQIGADGQIVDGIDAAMEYEDPEEPTDPWATLPCVNPRDPAALRGLVRQFVAIGGTADKLTRADVIAYLARCS